jgi:hypothetical protein
MSEHLFVWSRRRVKELRLDSFALKGVRSVRSAARSECHSRRPALGPQTSSCRPRPVRGQSARSHGRLRLIAMDATALCRSLISIAGKALAKTAAGSTCGSAEISTAVRAETPETSVEPPPGLTSPTSSATAPAPIAASRILRSSSSTTSVPSDGSRQAGARGVSPRASGCRNCQLRTRMREVPSAPDATSRSLMANRSGVESRD